MLVITNLFYNKPFISYQERIEKMYNHGWSNDNGHLTAPNGKKIDLRPVTAALIILSNAIKYAFDGVDHASPEYETIKAGIMDQISIQIEKLASEIDQ
jgi:hypothetical protein